MFPAHQREQVELPVQIPPGVALHALDDAIHGLHEAVAVLAHAVERARLDEAFHGPAVHFVAVQPLAEIIQAGIGLFPTLFHDAFHKIAAHALDRVQAEPDLPLASAVKPPFEMLISGGSTRMPRRAHSPEYSMTLSVLSSTLVSKAAMNSLG